MSSIRIQQSNEGSDLETFFGKKIPPHLAEIYSKIPYTSLDQEGMIKIIDFHPPFLRAEKIAIFHEQNGGVDFTQSSGGDESY